MPCPFSLGAERGRDILVETFHVQLYSLQCHAEGYILRNTKETSSRLFSMIIHNFRILKND